MSQIVHWELGRDAPVHTAHEPFRERELGLEVRAAQQVAVGRLDPQKGVHRLAAASWAFAEKAGA